jgi:hypothetical protein
MAAISAWRRAALGGLGYWWLALAEALNGRRLLLGPIASAKPRAAWESSAPAAVSHVIAPLCTPAHLAPALLWAVAALVLPWIVRRASGRQRAVFAAAWAGALIVASLVLAHRLGTPDPPLPLAAAAFAAVVALSIGARRFRLPARASVA